MHRSPRSPEFEPLVAGERRSRARRPTPLGWLALLGGIGVCLVAFAALTELVVHQWLGLAQREITGAALLFFGGWWVLEARAEHADMQRQVARTDLAAARQLRSTASTESASATHPTLLAYAAVLPRAACLAFLAILAGSAIMF